MVDQWQWQQSRDRQRMLCDRWVDEFLARGGTEAEVLPLLNLRSAVRELLRRGPCGYGALPSGCVATADPALVQRGRFPRFTAYRDQLVARCTPVIAHRVVALGMSTVDPRALPGGLAALWLADACFGSDQHSCWLHMATVSIEHECQQYLQYRFARILGADPFPELDTCLAAFLAGYLPVHCEHDAARAFALPAEALTALEWER